MKRLGSNSGVISFLASLTSIIIGLIFGYILLLLLNASNATAGMVNMLTNGIRDLGNVLYRATPLIMVGLAVAFAFKVGLFDIGASGQYTMGAVFALYCGLVFKLPWYLCLLASIVGGAVWGFFPGLFKALFNVNEVITSIMLNWIGMNLSVFIISNTKSMLAANPDRTMALSSGNPAAMTPKMGLDKLYSNLNIGILIAIVVAILIWVILARTNFGYELRACGLNRDGAIYAGINAKRNIVLSMVIAGGLAGLGGGLYYMAGGAQFTLVKEIISTGFDGISVALLANSNPIACIFSALFISYLDLGGIAMQSQGYATEATDIVTSVIIYLAAFSLLLRIKLTGIFSSKKEVAKK